MHQTYYPDFTVGDKKVLLMHGKDTNSDIWLTTDTIFELIREGFEVTAIDVPLIDEQMGKSSQAEFIDRLLTTFNFKENVVVASADTSCNYMFNFLQSKYHKNNYGRVTFWCMISPDIEAEKRMDMHVSHRNYR